MLFVALSNLFLYLKETTKNLNILQLGNQLWSIMEVHNYIYLQN